MKLVVDASVALKWFFRQRADEADADLALGLLRAVGAGKVMLVQPPHFIAEMAAVLARESPDSAAIDFTDLLDIRLETRADPAVFARAMRLSIDLQHHLFDTLYHAVAIETQNTRLVTADLRYQRKAADARVCTLAQTRDWFSETRR